MFLTRYIDLSLWKMFLIDHAIFCFRDVFIREQHDAVPEFFGIILNELCNDVEIKSCMNIGQKKLGNSKLDGCKRKTGNNTLTRVLNQVYVKWM